MRLSALLMFLLALASSSGLRCETDWKNSNGYNEFSAKHILPKDLNSKQEWEEHLQKKGQYLPDGILCGRKDWQEFFRHADEARIEKICNGAGFEDGKSNLCVSEQQFTVNIVESYYKNGKCTVGHVKKEKTYVVVGCGKIQKYCQPVHLEKRTSEAPEQTAPRCKLPKPT